MDKTKVRQEKFKATNRSKFLFDAGMITNEKAPINGKIST